MARKASPKIALLGFQLESNRFAPAIGRGEFEKRVYIAGDDILPDVISDFPRSPGSLVGFVRTMNGLLDWRPMPILVTYGGAAGPAEHSFYEEVREEMRRGLEAAMPLDAVFFAQHGAATTTEIDDPDGEMFAMARRVVGPDVPIVATLDLHANVSERMVDNTDLLLAYLTNPHVDQLQRGAEAAHTVVEMLDGVEVTTAFIRLPLVAPQVSQLTASGPFGELIEHGQTLMDDVVINVSILGGFTYSDTPDNGMAFLVATRGDQARARMLCRELAERAWNDRDRFVPHLVPYKEAIRIAAELGDDPSRASLIFADVADNPGSGAGGNTTWLLEGLVEAKVKGSILGPFTDPELAAEAHEKGRGALFRAVFNRVGGDEFSKRFEADARVLSLSNGGIVGRMGATQGGMSVDLGPTAALQVGAVKVVVITNRAQAMDSGYFENFGVSVAEARSVFVKSRGHFRAGFAHFFPPERVREVDAPGLASPNLANFSFSGFRRPIFPLDGDAVWTPPEW